MPNWDTRLEVSVGGQTITPITAFTPTFSTPRTVIHSLEATNVGFVRGPFTFSFTITVPAIGSAVANLTDLALKGTSFDLTIAEKQGTDWTFNRLLFANCVITQAQPGSITVSDVPSATFTCIALTATIEKGS
ncbi:MAG TPA: hypothetical protein VKX46_08290 [Ktedonobacteraceae bacterium]|nr:hypothetical protein [Ktedonobacteraceae bacterium]